MPGYFQQHESMLFNVLFNKLPGYFQQHVKHAALLFIFKAAWLSGGATQLLPRDGEAKELRTDPTVEPHATMQTTEPKADLHIGSEARKSRKI